MHTKDISGKSKLVVIFGGLGFIGHRLAHSLSNQYAVHVIDNCLLAKQQDSIDRQELERRHKQLNSSGVTIHSVDIFDDFDFTKLLEGKQIDTVIHMAGVSSVRSAYKMDGFQGTVGITQKILTDLDAHSPQRFIYFSSSMVYGDFQTPRVAENHAKQPVDVYGAYKYASEILVNGWCNERSIISIILRPTAVYGTNDIHKRVVSRFIHQVNTSGAVTILGNGENKLDFTHVDDVVCATKSAVEHLSSDEFNISFGHARSLNELLNLIRKVYPKTEVVYNEKTDHPIASRGTLCSDKAMRMLNYEPRFPLELGLNEVLKIEDGAIENQELEEFESLCEAPLTALSSVPMKVPLSRPDLISSDFDIVVNTLQSGWLTTGPQNAIFEQQFLDYLSPEIPSQALTLNSCASALILALRAADISGEVIVPAFTFSATVNAVELAGAIPRFVDIEANTLGIDVEKLEAAINQHTQAILVVHLAGVCCEIEAILGVAKKHDLLVIEDCAQALGAEMGGVKAGTLGDIACFSFFPTKMITTGEGGMLVASNQEYFDRAKALANHGYNSSTLDREATQMPWLREQVVAGYNFRMSNINAALGVAQMNRINDIVAQRRAKAQYVIEGIKQFAGITVFEYTDRYSVYQALNILVSDIIDRDKFVLKLRESGVMASVHYPEVLPNTPVFGKYSAALADYPIAQRVADQIVTLPLFGPMTKLQLDYVVSKICQVVKSCTSYQTSVDDSTAVKKAS